MRFLLLALVFNCVIFLTAEKVFAQASPSPSPSIFSSAAGIPCDGGRGVETAIGCVPTEPRGFINGLLKVATGIGGGVALLLMIFGTFQMITSGGNADSLKKGQEQFVAAIIGLVFIIFSVLLLQIIGADILNIPGFGR